VTLSNLPGCQYFPHRLRLKYTFTRLRASLTDILARKSARVGQVGGQVGEDRRACPARGKVNGEVAGHADFSARRGRPTFPCRCRSNGIPALRPAYSVLEIQVEHIADFAPVRNPRCELAVCVTEVQLR